MNNPDEVQFCPARTYVDYGQVQYADYSTVTVQDFSKVQYLEPSDFEEEEAVEEGKPTQPFFDDEPAH